MLVFQHIPVICHFGGQFSLFSSRQKNCIKRSRDGKNSNLRVNNNLRTLSFMLFPSLMLLRYILSKLRFFTDFMQIRLWVMP